MTVSTNDRRKQTIASASQTSIPYDFQISASSDLVVTQKVDATGVVSTLIETTDYTVNDVGEVNGGTIDLVSGAAVDDIITIEGQTPVIRATDFDTGGDYFATVVNTGEDDQYRLLQELTRDVDRSMILPPTALDTVSSVLPEPSGGQSLIWASDGLSIVNGAAADAVVSVAMQPVVAAATLAAARTEMDVEQADADILKADETDNLEVGFTQDYIPYGNSGTDSITLELAAGNRHSIAQTGVFTLNDPTTGAGRILIKVTDNGGAHGAPTFTGFSATLLPNSETWDGSASAINWIVIERDGTDAYYGVYN